MTAVEPERITWVEVCPAASLVPERGVAALVAGAQVALFLLADGSVRAVSNFDPFSGAFVLSRGLVGTVGPAPVVASPMYRHRFDLDTGACLDDERVHLPTWPARVEGGVVVVGVRRP